MLDVIYEDNHLLVVNKPINVPMMEDESGDLDLLNMCKAYIKEKYHKPGDVYLGLVHRLDRPVSGLCVFARTSKAASRLSDSIRKGEFIKEYEAVVSDNGLKDEDVFVDKLKKDHHKNMSFVASDGKDSKLSYQLIAIKDNLALVRIHLYTGRSHQIRVQFKSRNHPLFGDQRYNPKAKVGQQIALHSCYLAFPHPTKKEMMTFEKHAERYPFDIWREYE